MLAGAHGGHLQLLPQRGGTLGAVSLQQMEDLVGTGIHGVAPVVGSGSRQAFASGKPGRHWR
ncbi:hypothetical protein D3C86_1945220 [compost metagenome]